MPPKGSQKAKANEAPASKPKPKAATAPARAESESGSGSESPEPEPKPNAKAAPAPAPKVTPKKPAAQPTPRSSKKKDVTMLKQVDRDLKMPLQIDIRFEGESAVAPRVGDGVYGHTLKLQAANPFKLLKTIKFTSGEYEGCEAILLQPAKPFPFLKLPKEARAKVYTYFFAPNRVAGADIALEGKRANKDSYAKMYSEGSKYRVGLLTANKEVYDEAVQVLYDHRLKFENTTTLLDFLGQLPNTLRPRVRRVSIKAFVKTTARNAMHFLAESPNVNNLHIESGIFAGDDAGKAAKEFFDAAYKFLEAVGARKGDRTAGVDVLTFGRDAFTSKPSGDDKKKRAWGEEKIEGFREALKGKLS